MEEINTIKYVDAGCGYPHQRYIYNDTRCFGLDVGAQCKPDLVYDLEKGLPFEDGQLEFINSDNNLEHVRNPFFLLTEFNRCLQKNGTARIVLPNCQYFPLLFINLVFDLDRAWEKYMKK